MKKSWGLAAAVLGIALSGLAQATSAADDARRKEVYFGDLDLNSRSGVATLYRRIEAAARGVCALPNERMLAVRVKVRACVEETTARAFTEANAPVAQKVAARGLYIWVMNR
jgi:UrcA family protein